MDPLEVKDRILENISLSVKKLQSYFAACEDETPAIRNHDRVLQRLCEHLDHALLYGLQDISSGYWVLVLHLTRKEAVRQIDELQHIATNLGRSRAWLYLALSESSLESYLRLFQENQALLQKYYFKNALVCSHDHLALFLTLVSGLEFIRFDLDLDVPYLDIAPYMPEYYKPQNLLDFEERLPSSDSLSLQSFTSLTSTNLEWDDSAIAPSSEDYDFGDIFPVLQSLPSADWEDGDLTDPASCPRSSGSDPQTVVSDSVVLRSAAAGVSVVTLRAQTPADAPSPPHSPVFRHNPFNNDSDTNTSADATPVHVPRRQGSCESGEHDGSPGTQLEVIRMAKRRKPAKKRRGKGSSDSISSMQNSISDPTEPEDCLQIPEPEGGGPVTEADSSDGLMCAEAAVPLRDVMDRLNGTLDSSQGWGRVEEDVEGKQRNGATASDCAGGGASPQPPPQQPFREGGGGEPPDRAAGEPPRPALAQSPAEPYVFTPHGPEPASQGGGHHDPAGSGQPEVLEGADEGPGAAAAEGGQEPTLRPDEGGEGGANLEHLSQNETGGEAEVHLQEEKLSPEEDGHPAEFTVDNNHLLLLMIHVFRENEEQLFKMVRMSTGHMEGDLQALYLLLTDCYIYLLRKGAAEKPYTVEEAVSYNELDYISVGLDKQTVTLVCTNRRRQFLLDAADYSLTLWLLSALRSAMVKGCREPPYPSVLTDATMEKLALTKFVSQEAHCEVSEVSIQLYSLVHWEDPMDTSLSPHRGPPGSSSTKEGCVLYRAGSTYLGKELNGILYQYAERTDIAPLLSITMGGERCGGCRRSNSTEKPQAFQVILTERPPLELSANDEQDMAEWMLLLCQVASKGVVPQGASPTPCTPCDLCLCVQVVPQGASPTPCGPSGRVAHPLYPLTCDLCVCVQVVPQGVAHPLYPLTCDLCLCVQVVPQGASPTPCDPSGRVAHPLYPLTCDLCVCVQVVPQGASPTPCGPSGRVAHPLYPLTCDLCVCVQVVPQGASPTPCTPCDLCLCVQVVPQGASPTPCGPSGRVAHPLYPLTCDLCLCVQVVPQGASPTPCIPCCLVLTDSHLLTCHQDCQTSFFRSLGTADLCDIASVRLQADQRYCIIEFVGDRAKFLPPWVLYFSGCGERDRLLEALETAWKDIFQVELPRSELSDPMVKKRCGEALALMSNAWQRADSLARGRAQREPWC
ncbi:hypothetical protein NHX12_010061 [Muraenolepis orangiensis]|uniref:Pleckstrin homology domain-containing family M member 2 n=1 Tax=Muraenolepis orangiensis TaxID=630683 RepID=A0A9Q0DIU6_9TELE|nr:hypothetical protein NHX12_010061 [Muraenolepis orangiensis]